MRAALRCFYNVQHEAVGVCRFCLRGVCVTCSTELEAGLACKDRCEAGVSDNAEILKYNSALIKRYHVSTKQQGANRKASIQFCFTVAMLLCVGGIFCWITPKRGEMAAVLFGFATVFFLWARSHRKSLELEAALIDKK